MSIREITVAELESLLATGARLVDVRETDEYESGHVPGAVLVVLGTSGAMSWFAPFQPVLGAAAVVLLAVTLRRTLRATGPLACGA